MEVVMIVFAFAIVIGGLLFVYFDLDYIFDYIDYITLKPLKPNPHPVISLGID